MHPPAGFGRSRAYREPTVTLTHYATQVGPENEIGGGSDGCQIGRLEFGDAGARPPEKPPVIRRVRVDGAADVPDEGTLVPRDACSGWGEGRSHDRRR
ncbi:MAG: hypothetical protein NVSMB12_04490 [Acidimicrobiales bacterium]